MRASSGKASGAGDCIVQPRSVIASVGRGAVDLGLRFAKLLGRELVLGSVDDESLMGEALHCDGRVANTLGRASPEVRRMRRAFSARRHPSRRSPTEARGLAALRRVGPLQGCGLAASQLEP